jgi:KaiC/GvpD/RAD55 family RecA-like ATPase
MSSIYVSTGGLMSDINLPVPNFDTAFQRGILKLALKEDYFASQLVRYLGLDNELKRITVFNTKQLQIIFDCIGKSLNTYNTRPSDAQVRQYIVEFAPEEQDAIASTYEQILSEDTHDETYFKSHLTAFVQQAKTGIGFYKIRECWKENKLATIDMMQEVIDGLRRVSFEQEDILTLANIESITSDTQASLGNVIPTGLEPLDKDLLGGLPREALVTVLGGTNVGKSLFCISVGANAVRSGFNVLHIQLEGQRNEALLRYASNLAGVPMRAMMQNTMSPMQRQQIGKVESYKNLQIRNMLGFGVTVEDLAAKCREIYKDYKFDMLIIDYSQLLDCRTKTEGYRHTQRYVHQALSSIARELSCVVVSPIQATREAHKDQTQYKSRKSEDSQAPVLRSSDISEAFDIARVSAVIITLNRTDDEAREGKLRVYLEKQRMDEKNKTYGVMTDYSCCRLITKDTYDPRSIVLTEGVFEKDGDVQDGSKLAQVLQMKDRQAKEDLRKKIDKLTGEHFNINGQLQAAAKQFGVGEMSDEEKTRYDAWKASTLSKRDGVLIELKGLVALYYPQATKELYETMKASLKDLEKDGTAPKENVREHKERIKHFSYLYDDKSKN